MKLTLVKKIIQNKLKGDTKLPEDEIIAGALHEAMYFICGLCVPDELVRDIDGDIGSETVLRQIQNGKCIVSPEYPDFTNTSSHLQIDETLTYASIYLALDALASAPQLRQEFKQKGEDLIAAFKANTSLVMYKE